VPNWAEVQCVEAKDLVCALAPSILQWASRIPRLLRAIKVGDGRGSGHTELFLVHCASIAMGGHRGRSVIPNQCVRFFGTHSNSVPRKLGTDRF
jgi:hypothetical protein